MIAKDSNQQVYFSNFSDLVLISGRAPIAANEYVAVVDKPNGSQIQPHHSIMVGTYKETFTVNGVGSIKLLMPGNRVSLLQIEMRKPPTQTQADVLHQNGFVQINAQNIDRKIQAETFSLIDLVINIVSLVLLLMALTSWLSYVFKLVVDRRGELETLTSFGISRWQMPLVFLAVRRRVLLRLGAETVGVFVAAGVASALLLQHISGLLLLLSWLGGWLLVFLTVYVAIFSYTGSPTTRNSKSVFWLRIFLSCIALGVLVLAGKAFWSDYRFWLAAILLVALTFGIRHSVVVKSLYGTIRSSAIALFVMIAMIAVINAVAISLWSATSSKEDLAVKTTMPYQALIRAETLPKPYNNSKDFQRFSYINPLDGVTLAGLQADPLIYSTDLQRYASYVTSGGVINDDSIMIGAALATRNKADVGSPIVLNGKTFTISHIVNSEQYAGMIVYLSQSSFAKIFGTTGNTIYATDVDITPIKSKLPPGSSVQTRDDYRQLYQSSASTMTVLVFSLSIAISLVSAFIAYQLLSVYISSIMWRLNVLRGFGITFMEFTTATVVHLLAIAAAALVLVLAFAHPLTDKLTSMILASTDTFINISVSPLAMGITFAEVFGFSILTSIVSYRSLSRLSIYQQYLQCAVSN
ncbi:hypothetical protein [Arcanobacterium hippocoleae]|uniref:hypothetical protein n=1 Tax=Arcanobacterium hippocoleae TaxID=149017 RepID=UPI00333EB027